MSFQHSVYMLALYAKSAQVDLTEQEKRDIKMVVARLKGTAL